MGAVCDVGAHDDSRLHLRPHLVLKEHRGVFVRLISNSRPQRTHKLGFEELTTRRDRR